MGWLCLTLRLKEISIRVSISYVPVICSARGRAWKIQGGTRHRFSPKGADDIAADVRPGPKKWKLQLPERTFKSKMSGLENKRYGSSRV